MKKNSIEKKKIAFMVLAHSNIDQLNLFIKQLLKYDYSWVFVLLDNKCKCREKVLKHERVILLKEEINIRWGDYSQIKATKCLIDSARSYSDFDYYSFHSGADLLIKPIDGFVDFLESDAYIEVEKMPIKNTKRCGNMERIGMHYPRFMRRKCTFHSPIRYARAIYMTMYKFKIHKVDSRLFWFGSSFFTVSKKMIDGYYAFLNKHPDYEKYFIHSLCADEIYFNTIFMNIEGAKITSDNNLFCIKWDRTEKYAGSPQTLTIHDKDDLLKSDAFFARKFDSKIDNKVIDYFVKKNG